MARSTKSASSPLLRSTTAQCDQCGSSMGMLHSRRLLPSDKQRPRYFLRKLHLVLVLPGCSKCSAAQDAQLIRLAFASLLFGQSVRASEIHAQLIIQHLKPQP